MIRLRRAATKSFQQQRLQYSTQQQQNNSNKKYVLSMFPYPSGNLHMGHVRVYTISDVIARAFRMNGDHVLHPMGWDAFGLPAENAAIERNVQPAEWTKYNIEQMKKQLELLDLQIDWDREISTCSPEYYKWTQWIFLQLFKTGHAYQKESYVNWDPVDQTVLANEQVDALGRSWRSGAVVEKKKLRQWFFDVKSFTPDLLNDLNELTEWPESVRTMQKLWIGESKGAEFQFKLKNSEKAIKVFTTRPDTIFGVTYLAIAPESDLVQEIVANEERNNVTSFVQRLQSMSGTKRTEQAGVSKEGHFLGVTAIHPLTGKEIPVYIADYVISDFAEGCVMGVPAHDTRDFEFAKKHHLEVVHVIKPTNEENGTSSSGECYTGPGTLINSVQFNGISNSEAKKKITVHASEQNVGGESTQYKIRDWLVSRQRYWGAPIPIIHCPQCGPVAVNENELPVKLPSNLQFHGKRGNPLDQAEDWVNVKCPCGKGVNCRRETDTMDTFVDSSWYFLRYTDPTNTEQPFSVEAAKKWMNVDFYIGGIEHAVLHLLYARFIHKFLRSQGYVEDKEPFKKLITQGMVQGETYKNPETEKYYKPDEIQRLDDGSVVDKKTGRVLNRVWEKMSKSKYNGVDPTQIVSKFGSDVIRLYILFKAPIEKELEWDPQQISGQERFVKKVESMFETFAEAKKEPKSAQSNDSSYLTELANLIDQTRKNVFEEQVLNTCISNLHKYTNVLHEKMRVENEVHSPEFETAILLFPSLLAPFAPKLAEKVFTLATQHLSNDDPWKQRTSVHEYPFPESKKLLELAKSTTGDRIKVSIAFNGKTRTELTVTQEELQDIEQLKRLVTETKEGSKYLEGKQISKVIVVQGKALVNFVVK